MFISKPVYVYLPTASSQVGLQKFVVSTSILEKLQCPLFHYPILQCWLFTIANFVVSAFCHYKSLQCPLFIITKVCSDRILSLQKFVVSALHHHKSLQCVLFHYKSLQCPLFIITKVCSLLFQHVVCSVLDHVQVQGI